jgi:precorrin-2 dehydrogenase/sirohydrochlorin ferrochelatase
MKEQNQLYPIFLKVDQLNILIIGGGNVALEKLTFLLKSSPNAQVKLVAKSYLIEVIALANAHNVPLLEERYSPGHLDEVQFVIAATDSKSLNHTIYTDAKERSIPINVADTPDLCDFYLGGIVTKGNVKIAISTNGKSPTLAKRLRQFFEYVLPEDINQLSMHLNRYRQQLRGDFGSKVNTLNKVTKSLIAFK